MSSRTGPNGKSSVPSVQNDAASLGNVDRHLFVIGRLLVQWHPADENSMEWFLVNPGMGLDEVAPTKIGPLSDMRL